MKRAATWILGIILLGCIAGVIYIAASPKNDAKFTELYILGAEGSADNYPDQLHAGETAMVTAGIVNREQRRMDYSLVVSAGSTLLLDVGPITLEHEQLWESPLEFQALQNTGRQRVDFTIYEDGRPEPLMEPVYLWLTVIR